MQRQSHTGHEIKPGDICITLQMEQASDYRPDEVIAGMVQLGDIDAFGILVKRYEDKMLRYARKFLLDLQDSEELVQEVFIKAYVNIQSFDKYKKFSSWLYRIAHNEFINFLKKRDKDLQSLFDPDTLFPQPFYQENLDADGNQEEFRVALNVCLNKLKPKYREPLVLYYFEEISYKEISEMLHIPVSTVGIRLQRGKKIIKSLYKELGLNS